MIGRKKVAAKLPQRRIEVANIDDVTFRVADLNAIAWHKPVYPVICNVEAELVTEDVRARDTLLRQVTGSVKWEQCMRRLIALGVSTFVEIGPGKVLCGLMRQIDRSKTCLNVGDNGSLQKMLEHLAVRA